MPVEEFFEKYHNTWTGRSPWRKKNLACYVQSWHAETGTVVYNLVTGVYDKGVKPCLRIVTDSVGEVILTADHPVLNADGLFVQAGSLKIGSSILAQGSMLPRSKGGKKVKRPRVTVEGLRYYRGGSDKFVICHETRSIYEYQRTHRARLVVEAGLNGLSYAAYLNALKTDPVASKEFQLLPRTVDVHHIDENPLNDDPTNLMVLEKAEHTLTHFETPEKNFDVEYTKLATVTEVVAAGNRRTFDLSMDFPCANFVVNDGIIVHNTGKTAAAKYIARQWGIPLFRIAATFQEKWLGQSESNFDTALQTAEAAAPCVLILDPAFQSKSTLLGHLIGNVRIRLGGADV